MTEPNAEPAGENVNLDVQLRPVSGVKPPAPLAIDTHMAENWAYLNKNGTIMQY